MVGHHVEQLAHAVRLERSAEAVETGTPAQLGVDLVVCHHIVAVHAARPRTLDRRTVDVADTQS